MFDEVGLEGKVLPTLEAHERSNGAVSLEVSSEVGFIRERLAADRTVVGLLPCVSPHVSLQQPRPGERLPTDVAVMACRVGSHVHRESRHRDVDLDRR